MSKNERSVKYSLYTIGDLSSGIYGIGPAILLMFYMTNILGIPVEIATVAASLPKFLDLIFSPFIGGLSDRCNTRMGRRKPFLLASGLLVFPLFTGIWAAPFTDPIHSAWFIASAYVACSLFYTAFLVPYCALNSEIATGYNDNASLNSFRASYSMLGCLLAGAGAPMLVEFFGGGRDGYMGMGVSLAAIMSVSMLITFWQAKEPPRPSKVEKITFREMLQAVFQNKPFLVLSVTYMLHMIAGGVLSTGLAYFVTYILLKDISILAGMFFLTFGTSVIAIPLFLWLSKRIGKYLVFSLSLVIAAFAASLYFLLDQNSSMTTVYSTAAFMGFAEGAIQAFAYAMLSDCIIHGDRRQGATLSGFFIAFEKLSIALGSLTAGAIFTIAGLVETVDGAIDQPESALTGIGLSVTVVPILLNVAAILIFLMYRSFDKKIAKVDLDTHLSDSERDQMSPA